jgi:hypothetical protein
MNETSTPTARPGLRLLAALLAFGAGAAAVAVALVLLHQTLA